MINPTTTPTQPAAYIVHPDVDLSDATQPRFYWQVTCRYPRPIGAVVVNVTTIEDSKWSAIAAVWKEIGRKTIDRVVAVPF